MTGPAHAIEMQVDDPVYSYKPSLMGAAFEFRLASEALEWRKGRYSGRTPYDCIRRIRLSFRPVTMQSYRFLTEIWPADGPSFQISSTSWRSLVEHERNDAAYAAFVVELNRRIAAVGGRPSFETGSPPLIYWLGLAVFVIVAVSLAALTVRALQVQTWSGAGFVAAFLALFLWQLGSFFYRNRPGSYRPDALPPQLLPKA